MHALEHPRSKEAKLFRAITVAEARFEAIGTGKIRTAANASWQAAAWMLERRFPDRYWVKSRMTRARV